MTGRERMVVPRWVWLGAATAAVCAVGEVGAEKVPGMLISSSQRPGLAFAPPPVLRGSLGGQRRAQAGVGISMQWRNDYSKHLLHTEGLEQLPIATTFLRVDDDIVVPEAPSAPSQLVTYGDVFRAALTEEEEREKLEEEKRRIKPVAVAASVKGAAAASVKGAVRAVLERLMADPPAEEISRNMEAFAQRHSGVVGLPVVKGEVQTKVDLDRLEAVLELELDGDARDVHETPPAKDEDCL